MLTKKVKNRIFFLTLILLISTISIFFIVQSLNKNILYFSTPTDIKQKQDLTFGEPIRIGGMVKKNSIKTNSENIIFVITDLKSEIFVSYKGTVPNLFAEGKGVVAEGVLRDKNFFIASQILAKHDENYMPPELKNLVKKNAK
jgi:cytochrome c-type biogenesis protein CcmE|tara:strand:- start:282 stop:710 length:429 start_codon:yes stop_codon:yes gene_type:complete